MTQQTSGSCSKPGLLLLSPSQASSSPLLRGSELAAERKQEVVAALLGHLDMETPASHKSLHAFSRNMKSPGSCFKPSPNHMFPRPGLDATGHLCPYDIFEGLQVL